MNWTARYVAQVKSYLPVESREDVGEELSSLLSDKTGDREEELGRELTQEEEISLLRNFGHPLKVASAYRASGPLISEALFPLYILCIRYLVVILVALYAVSLIAFYVSGQRELWPNVGLADLVNMGLFYFGAITLGFHLTDRYLQSKDFLANWNPKNLPREDAERVSIFETVTILILILAWFRILTAIPVEHSLEQLFGLGGSRFFTFILWLKLQVVLCAPVFVWLLLRPYWSIPKRAIIIVSDLAVGVGITISLSIDNATFAAHLVELGLEWESSQDIGTVSTVILTVWMLGVGWDIVHHGIRIWRSLR